MKVSELINSLKNMISNYGDLEIITEVEDIFEVNKAIYGDVEFVLFNAERICISGKETSISDWVKQYNDNCTITVSDHYSVFRKFDAPKESTGLPNGWTRFLRRVK